MKNQSDQATAFLFDKSNFVLVISGLLLIITSSFLMSGGESSDPAVFNADELYSFRRITLAPILFLIGLILQIAGIMKKPKS